MSGLRPTYPLRTERLDLRPHRMDDLDDLYAFHSRPEVVRYTPWPVRDREETRKALEKKLAQDALTEAGQWLVLAIELRETGTVIGEVLLKWASETDRQGEIGYALQTDHQGKGLPPRPLGRFFGSDSRTSDCIGSRRSSTTATPRRRSCSNASACAARGTCSSACSSRANGPASTSTRSARTNGGPDPLYY